ncbi:hypothetical protein D3C72_310220 [compost metagenome]
MKVPPVQSRALEAVRTVPGHLVLFAAGVLVLLLFTVASPLLQFVQNHGYLFYENGFDETAYLQYDFSLAAQSPTRPGQYLVTLAHQLGLSGGYINAVADVVMFVGFPLIVRSLLRRVGWSASQASWGALLMLVVPQFVLLGNPIVQRLHLWTLGTGMIQWLTLPINAASPLARTPEPQFSLMLLGAAMLLGLRWRRFWPVYGVLPFMYPFVAIPAGFVALACHLHTRWPAARFATVGPLVLAFLAIATACWGYYTFLVKGSIRLAMLASHLPLISFTSVVALGVYGLLHRWIAPEHRFFALAVALGALVGTNQQVLSGHIPQPYSFEYYFGSVAVALLVTIALRHQRLGLKLALLLVGGLLFFNASFAYFQLYRGYVTRLPMTNELAMALQQDSSHVVVNDSHLASLLGMVHPRQASTALAFERSYPAVADRYVAEYRCVKQQIQRDYPEAFKAVLARMDENYTTGGQAFIFATLNRRTTFTPLRDMTAPGCKDPGERPLRYVFVNGTRPTR